PKQLSEVVEAVGRYPEEAYHFLREGLNYAVERTHGPPSAAHLTVSQYMAEHCIDLTELIERLEEGKVEPDVLAAIEATGGFEKLNRHVSGQELCWALRDLALKRWGPLAALVLRGWNISETIDFGRIVFALIEHDLMQKQTHDRLDDFDRVYDFTEALTHSFRIGEDSRDGPHHGQ
ncbi:MAG: Minf_1886 family protein, partial [Planctomycetota bacterium]